MAMPPSCVNRYSSTFNVYRFRLQLSRCSPFTNYHALSFYYLLLLLQRERMFSTIHILLSASAAMGVQVPDVPSGLHDLQFGRRLPPSSSNAYFYGSSCSSPAQSISSTSECDEAAAALGLSLGYRGSNDYGGDCAKWVVLGMQDWYYHHGSTMHNAQPICKLPVYVLGSMCPVGYAPLASPPECIAAGRALALSMQDTFKCEICGLQPYIVFHTTQPEAACPAGFASISSPSECDEAAAALGLGLHGAGASSDYGGDCAKWDGGSGQQDTYFHHASNQPGASPICAAVQKVEPTPSPTLNAEMSEDCTELVVVDGTSATDWGTTCRFIPAEADHIKIGMGEMTDYFKPVAGADFCDMLTSSTQHQWSNDVITWRIPDYYHNHFGGSAANWPSNNVEGDGRRFLPFWGDGVGGSYGCCHNSYTDAAMPLRIFKMSWCRPPRVDAPSQVSAQLGPMGPMAPATGAMGSIITPAATPAPPTTGASAGQISAVGDPHLTNIFGQKFDLMRPGWHVMISIPRGEGAEKTLLHVEADAHRLGGSCADLYFQKLSVTGAWAEMKQKGGYHYRALDDTNDTQEWLSFGKVDFKIAHGRTQSGIRYLNLFARHLGRAGFDVGGLLGEDDHSEAAEPPASCSQSLSLVQGGVDTSGWSSSASVAEATLD
ncbi:unnamed protein product [Prorocentrum cordatum]|uniref:Uncharacterized protein n=1 Tax=Prorocentrum cordatum TaxID=2364126 RepID=A0ABN9XIW7_9DINO|nr:unnamed protein product [Polarella glacialis]